MLQPLGKFITVYKENKCMEHDITNMETFQRNALQWSEIYANKNIE